jgi:hypothetical protein
MDDITDRGGVIYISSVLNFQVRQGDMFDQVGTRQLRLTFELNFAGLNSSHLLENIIFVCIA